MKATEPAGIQPAYLNVSDSIRYSGIRQTRLYESMRLGRLPWVQYGRTRLIKVCDLDALLTRLHTGEA